MAKDWKHKAICLSFILVLAGFMLAHILLPHREISYTEGRTFRRPEFSREKLFSGRMAL